jgi:hypothetical protein
MSYKPNQLSPHFLEPPNTKGSLLPMLIVNIGHMPNTKPILILSPYPTCILIICFNYVHKGQNNCLQDFTIDSSIAEGLGVNKKSHWELHPIGNK